jgi:hypothetical protein
MTKHAKTTAELAASLDKTLSIKGRAQYAPIRYSHEHAAASIEQAQELLDGATAIVK